MERNTLATDGNTVFDGTTGETVGPVLEDETTNELALRGVEEPSFPGVEDFENEDMVNTFARHSLSRP